MIEHSDILGTKWEIRGREQAWKRTLVVITGLPLNPDDPDYDGAREASMLEAITSYWANHPVTIDAINVRSTRDSVGGYTGA